MSPLLDSILSQLNPVHTLTPYSFKIHFNIILPSMSRSPNQVSQLKFSINFLSPPCLLHVLAI